MTAHYRPDKLVKNNYPDILNRFNRLYFQTVYTGCSSYVGGKRKNVLFHKLVIKRNEQTRLYGWH
jgi:hypothetical protein